MTPYDGYHRRAVPPPDPELTEVGPGTAGGEYLRRFWQPVAFVRELGPAPLRVRILGEDLVVFRDRAGHDRRAAPALRAPRDVARVRHSRRARSPVLLSRLGVRRRRPLPGDARRASRQPAVRARRPGRLSSPRVHRARLRVPRAARSAAAVSPVRQLRGAGLGPDAGGEVRAAVQLAAGEGQQHGPGAHRVPARAEQRLPVHRSVRSRARAGLDDDRGRDGLHRHAPGGRAGVGARVRLHAAQRAPVHARDRGGHAGQERQPTGDHPLGRAQRRRADRPTSSWPRSTRRGA